MLNVESQIYKYVALLLFLLLSTLQLFPQYKVAYDNDFLTSLSYRQEKNNGFQVSVSLVALFTTGVADRNGFRLGAGITLSQTVDNWSFSTGLDTYKANQKFGIGTTFAGVTFDDGKYGVSYYVNKYHQGDKQVSGIAGLHLDEFVIRFEDDILAYPFTGFKVYDRYRTAALEVRYKDFMIGSNVYTTDINGLTDASLDNSRGVYHIGKQISSPLYVGYTTNNMLFRYGLNSNTGGMLGQNSWHRLFFNTPDFKHDNYSNQFMQIGVDKPYTLY